VKELRGAVEAERPQADRAIPQQEGGSPGARGQRTEGGCVVAMANATANTSANGSAGSRFAERFAEAKSEDYL